MKGIAAVSAAAAMYGCGSLGAGSSSTRSGEEQIIFGSSGHNCGGRCVSRAVVQNGRIQRILTDESTHSSDGTLIDTESRNFPQTRSCARCRAYKYRLYHPGRLKYPLKQTKKRGDLSGFVRISWEQAYEEIATKHKAVLDKYGVDGIYQIYACGSVSSTLNGAQSGAIGKTNGYAMKAMGGVQTPMFGSYSTHQNTYVGVNYTGMDGNIANTNSVANYANHLVMWGDNSMVTANPSTYATVRIVEDMKKRNPNSKAIFIGPEFVDGAVTMADEWIVSKPYTDPALIAGMVYHMLDNTFDLRTGALKANPWLDVDYLDTLVYGFFDSPAYGMSEESGTIDVSGTGDRKVPAVPAGRSYASWVLGNNNAARSYTETKTNYTAARYGDVKRWAPCSYEVSRAGASQYKTKQDFRKPKTPAWASAITGVPEEAIKRIAELFCKGGPITSRWSGGAQKQADGITNLLAIQTLHIVTKNVGTKGAGYMWMPFTGANITSEPTFDPNYSPKIAVKEKPRASCTAWHTAIKMGFADELMAGGYRAKYIPNWKTANSGSLKTGDGDIYWDDGGTKAMICWERNEDGSIKTYTEGGNTYYQWKGKDEGKAPVIAGIRLLYNPGGNIFMNQHENSNDSREMLECLPLNDPNNADTFCMVSMDNFLSASPRWSDYVLPATTFWEQDDVMTPINHQPYFMRKAIDAPGEAKALWDIGVELATAYEDVSGEDGVVAKFTEEGKTVAEIVRKRFEAAPDNSPLKKMSWEEYLQNPFVAAKPNDEYMPKLAREAMMANFAAADKKLPFIKKADDFYVPTNEISNGGYGNDFSSTADAPKSPLRFQVYSPVLVWQYDNKFSKWHGYLADNKRGQTNTDMEGDRRVLEIPLYYAYEDYFLEAYNGKHKDLPFLMTTTHNRYRNHSSMVENPLLRELSHRVPGESSSYMGYNEGNDYGNYATMPEMAEGVAATIAPLNAAIELDGSVTEANKPIASYTEVLINETDGKALGIATGDLVQIENPVGAVRCVAKLTKRCVRGFIGLHQGCWYDPRPLPNSYGHDFVDVGGNCNTLMASQPSRIDHGNGQQTAMVKITKVIA
jgi:anaerobic selenocysteine-containing dehydrogenase